MGMGVSLSVRCGLRSGACCCHPGRLAQQSEYLAVEPFGAGGLRIRAGEEPQAGDTNRRDYPRAYVQADALVRAVRASTGMHFFAPWSEATIVGHGSVF